MGRKDTCDGEVLTFERLEEKYKNVYQPDEVSHWWDHNCAKVEEVAKSDGDKTELDSIVCVDALEEMRKSEASDLDRALAQRMQRHKSLESRQPSNSSELDGAVRVDANNSVPNDDAMEMMRKKRSRKVQTLRLRQHSNSSNLGADIKLPGEEQEAQAELNKPEEEDADINNKKTHVEDEEEVGNREIHVNVTGGIAVNVVGAKPSEVEENRKKKKRSRQVAVRASDTSEELPGKESE